MKGIFDAYVLWPFDKKEFELVTRINTRDFTAQVSDPAVMINLDVNWQEFEILEMKVSTSKQKSEDILTKTEGRIKDSNP